MALDVVTGILNAITETVRGFLGMIKNMLLNFLPSIPVDFALLGLAVIVALILKTNKIFKGLIRVIIIYNIIIIYLLLKMA